MKFADVRKDELEEIGRRRAGRAGRGPESAAPAPDDDLIGLSFSGGGIRSATFNLGLVRGLHRWGLLDRIDYLSTVSGGGYIGSALVDHYRQGQDKASELLAPRARSEAETEAETETEAADRRGTNEPRGVTRLRGLGRFLTPTGSIGEWLVALVALLRGVLWNTAFFVAVSVALAALISFALDEHGQWIVAFPHGTASACAFAVVLGVVMFSVLGSGPLSARWLLTPLSLAILVGVLDALPFVLAAFDTHQTSLDAATVGAGLVGLVSSGALSRIPASVRVIVARVAVFLLGVLFPLGLFLAFLLAFCEPDTRFAQYAALGAGLALAFMCAIVDINRTSLHGFHKQRIAATFLSGSEDPRLSQFVGADGPLHLINAALNLPGESDPSVRDRLADFFTFSCLHAGGPRTGYCDIRSIEEARHDFTLASAIAISGAAAAPNMGSATDAMLRPIMTMLNIRMGYWLPHPARVARESGWTPSLGYLFKEMTGRFAARREKDKLINLSDGGHIENLGAFELLRRRCKLIIIGDGECDPDASFAAMATLIRLARVELDAEIDIDLDDLRVGPDGYSVKHATVGTIRYLGDGEQPGIQSVGRILYLKSSLTGHEPPDVRYYKSKHPDFPHETTADQWFDDAQFDAYLALGEEVVDSLFQCLGYASPDDEQLRDDSLEERLAALHVILAPTSRSRSSVLTDQFYEVQDTLLRPEFADYRSQLVPTIFSRPVDVHKLHELTPVVMLQLQLMESAVEHLDLVDTRNRQTMANRGWMNLFRSWAQSEAFQRVALICLPSFGARLQQFVDVGLELGTSYAWTTLEAHPGTLFLGETNPQIDQRTPGRLMITGLANCDELTADRVVISRVVLRPGFEGRDRLEAAFAALRHKYSDRTIDLRCTAAELARALPDDAYLHRPRPSRWSAEDEALVQGLIRGSHQRTSDTGNTETPGRDADGWVGMDGEIPYQVFIVRTHEPPQRERDDE